MERIHVSVRARPLSPEDSKTSPWKISGNSISFSNNSSLFEFDRIFGDGCKTAQVYQSHTKDIVAAAVRGFNGTVFAYGQTNSGKTHTMRGSSAEPGVTPLAVRDLFDTIQEDMDREFLLRMSYMEIYNEEINDLLAPEHRKLQIHESLDRGIYVAGLREEIVATPDQVLDFMEFGESHRHIGETNMNLYSSRSHTIFRMIIESRDRSQDEDVGSPCDAVRVSVLNLVDLAGSERAAKTGAEGVRLKEGSHINKSLMTLGTVIKKLSEGAESQGGHVPYRDSKLTRILQPALGGNANTAIICNITLAQIHADETKSSLQFASRALRVTNCAHVNEILTDAALLKRQKKEIEELRAKLKGHHSEHLEEEILNLRNTLLQTELERERIALELEEEKKAQAERDKRLQEQAKKIENLSTMVLISNRDGNREYYKKEKRRDTWCPGKPLEGALGEAHSTSQYKTSLGEAKKAKRDVGPLLPFTELLNETELVAGDLCNPRRYSNSNKTAFQENTLPEPPNLLLVTNRKRGLQKKKNLENNQFGDMIEEFEDLTLQSEIQRMVTEICLIRKLYEAKSSFNLQRIGDTPNKQITANIGDKSIRSMESEAILVIKQLQEQIKMLQMEKSSSQQNLDSVVELATEQNTCAREQYEELYEELQVVREEARVARELLAKVSPQTSDEGNIAFMTKLLTDIKDVMLEVEGSKYLVDCVSTVMEELFQNCSAVLDMFLELKSSVSENLVQLKSVVTFHENLHHRMEQKIMELENEKVLLQTQSGDLHKQMELLTVHAENSAKALKELIEQQDLQESEFISQIEILKQELSYLSSGSLFKEKETLRKDMEKTKSKLKETEFKLKNAIQEKTKLAGERAHVEREMKQLQGQKAFLERDISKRDSLANKRRDSVLESVKVHDVKKAKGHGISYESMSQDEYKKLEVLAFEMEATIGSLEDQIGIADGEKDELLSRNEILFSELESLSKNLSISNTELNLLQEEISGLKFKLEESESCYQQMQGSIVKLVDEKNELAMQLTNALLDAEEEKAIWYAKEKASIKAIEEKGNSLNAEIDRLSKGLIEATNELESVKAECMTLKERLASSEEILEKENQCSWEKSVEIEQLKDKLKKADSEYQDGEVLKSNFERVSLVYHQEREEVEKLAKELSLLRQVNKELSSQIVESSDTGPSLSEDFQSLKNHLHMVTMERDSLMAQVTEQNSDINVEVLKQTYDQNLSESNIQVAEFTQRICNMEAEKHIDGINNCKERAKMRMRLHWAQAKLDAFRRRHKEATEELALMDKKYEEAAAKLKDRLVSYASENLHLKKQLAATTQA